MSLFETTEQIDEDRKASEMKLVYYNLMIVAIFIFCHTFKWIPNLFEWTLTHTNEVQNKFHSKSCNCFLATQHFPKSYQEVYSTLALDAGLKFRLQLLCLQHQAQYFSNVDTFILS